MYVIEPDPNAPKKLNFTVREYQGFELYDLDAFKEEPKRFVTLKKNGDAFVGRRVVTQFFEDLIEAVICTDESGQLFLSAPSGKNQGCLEFAGDDRGCWVASGWYNAEALAKVDFRK